MKRRLIILSDLWGSIHTEWISQYSEILKEKFIIQFYDCCQLGEIDNKTMNQEFIHEQFIQFGIEKAVKTLTKKEKNPVYILGFSIGGTIAWKAALNGMKTTSIHAISATRLRFETQKPDTQINLFFGENDPHVPDEDWFVQQEIKCVSYEGKSHEFYKEKRVAEYICQQLFA